MGCLLDRERLLERGFQYKLNIVEEASTRQEAFIWELGQEILRYTVS